jgi:hypothetical protein
MHFLLSKCCILSAIILIAASCSTYKESILNVAEQTKYSVIKKTPATSKEEAANILQKRFNYLTLMYEQSRDPYYGHPKWSEYCLKMTKIGSVTKNEGVTSVSELYVDGNGNPGFCPEDPMAIHAFEVGFYCEIEQTVYQVTLPQKEFDMRKVNLCHSK